MSLMTSTIIIPSPSTSSSSSTSRRLLLMPLRFGYSCNTPKRLSIPSSSSSGFAPSRRRSLPPRRHRAARVGAVSANLGSSIPDPLASSSNKRYHPSEEISDSVTKQGGDDVRLSDAETARTLVEVNSKATLMFSGLTDDEIQENIIWPDLPYLTDEHGDIYFEVSNNEDILQTLIADDKIVQVIIGLDNIEMLEDLEMSGPSGFDFGLEEIESEDSDIDDDSDEDEFIVLEDDEDDDMYTSETSNDWTNLETMQSSHPIYFAKKISQVVSDINLDWMDMPSASIVVQGALRPAFVEENIFIKKHSSTGAIKNNEDHPLVEVAEENLKEELDKDQSLQSGTSFYKLEIIKIQLVSSYGTQSSVEVQDFRDARPDDVVHHSAKIISQIEAAGDKTVQALKSLCWRLKNIQVEEAVITGVDSLGFDLRVCSGTQVQTLRFAFRTRATSGFNAERQLHDLLFPRFQHKHQS